MDLAQIMDIMAKGIKQRCVHHPSKPILHYSTLLYTLIQTHSISTHNNRQTAATLCNKNSSRSHSIFTMKLMIREVNVEGEEVVRHGQLNLVDLAG
jgi:hypothetical protein